MASIPSEVRALAREHTAAAIFALVSIVNNDEAVPMARVQAANSLLDRAWGKSSNQPVSGDTEDPLKDAGIVCTIVDPKNPDRAPEAE
jgi:hypothetical protein